MDEYQGTTDVQAVARAVASMLDVVEELANGLSWRQSPEPDWAEQVSATFAEHRRELSVRSSD